MKTIVKCPSCKQPTIYHEFIYAPEEVREISFKDYVKSKVEEAKRESSGGTIYGVGTAGMLTYSKFSQVLFKCSSCGFTRVVDL